jgi:hypothetical protein
MLMSPQEYLILLVLRLLGGWSIKPALLKYVFSDNPRIMRRAIQPLVNVGWVWDADQQTPPDWFMNNLWLRSLYDEYNDVGFVGLTDKGFELVNEFPTKPLDI